MGKEQNQQNQAAQEKQKNKSHKTLRQKLRKKRVQQKAHLKEKKEKRKQFNPEDQKKQFFATHFDSLTDEKFKQAKKQFKYKKIQKYIQKFINIYQDDLQDFFGLFKQFDQGGFIDITGLQNKKLQKVLLKLFKYLPLNLTNNNESGQVVVEYRKKKQSTFNLQNIIRNLVALSIQNYMENGTQDQKDKSQQGQADSSQNQQRQIQSIKKDKTKKNTTVNIRKQDDEGIFTCPKPKVQDAGFGPVISQSQRQKIAQIFEMQLKQMQDQKQQEKALQQDQFQQIFAKGQIVNKLKDPKKVMKKSALQDIPEHLLAEGSAQIGQKVTINDMEQQQYDRINRPKRLIDQHRQIMAINRGQTQGNTNQRKPFDRQRDIVNSRNKLNANSMNNGLFFNFKDRMSAPKKTNSFL